MRTVKLEFDEGFHEVHKGSKKASNAVGYLVTWAVHNEKYCNLNLYGDYEGNLHAKYSDAKNNVTYVMFGMYDGDEFSFHS